MAEVFMSAHPSVRSICLPEMIGGMIMEVPDNLPEVEVLALDRRRVGYDNPPDLGPEVKTVNLVARSTGRIYHGRAWWEVVRADG